MNKKIKEFKHYPVVRLILNITSLIWIYLIGQTLFSLITAINDVNNNFISENTYTETQSWLPALIFPMLAVIFILATIVYSLHYRKSLEKMKLNAETIKKHLSIQNTAISAVRFITLHGIFEALYIQSLLILKISENFISIQVICDVILIIIIIRFTKYRISILVKKDDNKKERRIIES